MRGEVGFRPIKPRVNSEYNHQSLADLGDVESQSNFEIVPQTAKYQEVDTPTWSYDYNIQANDTPVNSGTNSSEDFQFYKAFTSNNSSRHSKINLSSESSNLSGVYYEPTPYNHIHRNGAVTTSYESSHNFYKEK